jgi:hypothetical protein
MVQFSINYLVVVSQNKPFLTLGKYEMNFSCEEKENTQNEHCLSSKVAHNCTIWGHLNKLWHSFGQDLTHLA